MKALLGILLIATALYCGLAGYPLWSILGVGVLFTAGYIHGKWPLWKPLLQKRDGRFWRSLLTTYSIQCILVGAFYLIGSGLGRMIGAIEVRS
ncbi:MAG: hypothetical protein WCD18_25205 [Thermosynechococcaceae cyanobacterium]